MLRTTILTVPWGEPVSSSFFCCGLATLSLSLSLSGFRGDGVCGRPRRTTGVCRSSPLSLVCAMWKRGARVLVDVRRAYVRAWALDASGVGPAVIKAARELVPNRTVDFDYVFASLSISAHFCTPPRPHFAIATLDRVPHEYHEPARS